MKIPSIILYKICPCFEVLKYNEQNNGRGTCDPSIITHPWLQQSCIIYVICMLWIEFAFVYC